MSAKDWRSMHPELVKILEDQLGNKESCAELIDGVEQMMHSILGFIAVLLGDRGANAVLARSIQLASPNVPSLLKIRIYETGVDFSEFRDHFAEADCNMPQAFEAVLRLGVAIFQTLSDLTGDSITNPLLGHLKSETDDGPSDR